MRGSSNMSRAATGTGIAPIFGMTPTAAPAPADATSQPAPTNLEMGPGHVLALAKGEKASFVNPARPNPSFGKFVEAVLDYLGAGTFIGSAPAKIASTSGVPMPQTQQPCNRSRRLGAGGACIGTDSTGAP